MLVEPEAASEFAEPEAFALVSADTDIYPEVVSVVVEREIGVLTAGPAEVRVLCV